MERDALASRVGRRRKLTLIGIGVALLSAIAIPGFVSGAAGTKPSSDINDYALYAVDTIQLKGGGLAGRSIINGNIGAGQQHWRGGSVNEWNADRAFVYSASGVPYMFPGPSGDPHVTLCQGSGDTGHLDVRGYVAAPSLRVNYVDQGKTFPPTLAANESCLVREAYATVLYKSFNMPSSVWHSSFTQPDVVMPALPKVTCDATKNANDFKGAALAPGTYGTYDFDGVTTLQAGTYTFCNVTVEQNASLKMTDGTIVNVIGTVDPFGTTTNGKLNLKGGATGTVGSPGARFNVSASVNFGQNGNYAGTFLAPNTDVALGNGTNLNGRVWALAMHSDWGVNVTSPPPPTSTTTTTTPFTTTTTIKPTTTTTTTVVTTTTTTTVQPTTTTTTTTVRPTTTTTTVRPTTTTTTVKPTTTTTTVPF
ncbi:MAG TPA: hypothetical protein VL856_19375 [Acidimicrobiia bacterium]|nr:hypothetical protein [Acidimicrobiia bacterium]